MNWLNWLIDNWDMFGLEGQNWMLIVAAGFLAYIAYLRLGHRAV